MTRLAKRSNEFSAGFCPTVVNWNVYLKLYVTFFVLISAVRYGVGGDSVAYAHNFKYGIPTHTLEDRSNEFVWVGFVDLINNYGIHFTVGMGLIAFLQIFFIIKSVKEFNFLLVSIPIVLFAGRFYLELMNGMRQMLVACAFLYFSRLIVERKFFQFCLFIWIAHYIHNSALMLLPLYFLPTKFILADKRKLCIIIFLICFIVGQFPSFQILTSYAIKIANLIGYSDYVKVLTIKLNNPNEVETMSLGITMISYFLMSFIVILFGSKLRNRYAAENPFFDLWYNYSFFYSCGFFLFCNVSHVFLRPFLYFELYLMIMLSLIINYCWDINNPPFLNKISNRQIYYYLLIILWIGLLWTLYRVISTGEWETIIYKTIFFHSI